MLSPKRERYTIEWDNVSDDEEYAAALDSNDPGRVTVYNPLGWAANDEDLHLELSEIEDEVRQTLILIKRAQQKTFVFSQSPKFPKTLLNTNNNSNHKRESPSPHLAREKAKAKE